MSDVAIEDDVSNHQDNSMLKKKEKRNGEGAILEVQWNFMLWY